MRKKNLKPIIISGLLACAFGATSIGTSFALFTDSASTSINIQAGKIDLKNDLSIIDAKSLNALDNTSVALDHLSASYVNGGQANVNEAKDKVTVQKFTPGDLVKVQTAPNNTATNIKTQMRMIVSMSGKLAPALTVKAFEKDGTEVVLSFVGERRVATGWFAVDAGDNPTAYDVEVAFPDHDNGAIRFGEDNLDNKYQNLKAEITIVYEAVQANAQIDDLIDRVNTTLAKAEIEQGKNKTMHDALADLASYSESDKARIADFVWGAREDMFFEASSANANYHYFKQASAMDASGYSIYAKADWSTAAVPLNGIGFDAGSASGITSISYTGIANEARENVIRTNSYSTTLTINAPLDTVKHYGDVGSTNIIAVANSSYHEFGNVAFAEIAKGRIVLETTASIKQIHINKTNEAFDTVVIEDNGILPAKLPEKITRDEVDVAAKTLVAKVVTSTGAEENVYVYPYTDAQEHKVGTTQKTEVQNENVVTSLGTLILDNGQQDGEKARNSGEKADEKAEVITEEKQEHCAHAHTHYVAEGGFHHLECEDCGKKLSDNAQHEYNAEDPKACTVCGEANPNAITYTVAPEASQSAMSLSEAISAYNTAVDEQVNKNFVIELESGIYTFKPNLYVIKQSQQNKGNTLTIKAKTLPVAGNYNVTFKPDYTIMDTTSEDTIALGGFMNNDHKVTYQTKDMLGSQSLFRVSGESSYSGGGNVTIKGIKFDFRAAQKDIVDTSKFAPGARLNIVYCDSSSGRYAHDITIDTCSLYGNGGKLASFFSANHNNSSPKNLTVKNCYGEKINCFFNAYGTNLTVQDSIGSEMLCIGNFQTNGISGNVENKVGTILNVDGSFMATYSSTAHGKLDDNSSEDGVIYSNGGIFELNGCDITTSKGRSDKSIYAVFYAKNYTSKLTVSNCTATHPAVGTYYDIYKAGGTLYINGTELSGTNNQSFSQINNN